MLTIIILITIWYFRNSFSKYSKKYYRKLYNRIYLTELVLVIFYNITQKSLRLYLPTLLGFFFFKFYDLSFHSIYYKKKNTTQNPYACIQNSGLPKIQSIYELFFMIYNEVYFFSKNIFKGTMKYFIGQLPFFFDR